MTAVTVLGLGPMGQALAGALLAAGHNTIVWNRTAAKGDDLVARGARRASTVAEAIEAGPLVIVCVFDYAVVESLVKPAAAELKGRALVNLTADSPVRSQRMAEWAADAGIDYLDGTILSPTTTIGGPDAVILYSGPEAVYKAHRPTLAAFGGTATYLGADPGRAAAYDVALLDLFWTAMSGVVHAFALARAAGISAGELAPFAGGIGRLLPPIIDDFARDLDAGQYPGDDSSLRSAVADMSHILEAARAHGMDNSVLEAAHAFAERAVDDGYGGDGFTRLAALLTPPGGADDR
jgi:3-hydroxyisobutyrate dehydrogenase-like beta-hydroxyacid dehydrogenase